MIDLNTIAISSTGHSMKQALDILNNILKKHSNNILTVYPKKAIASALFRAYRDQKISPNDLAFTNQYVSLG